MFSRSPIWPSWEESDFPATVSGKLIRNPDDPFEAWDEFGQPCLPMTLGDDCPSSGTTPGTSIPNPMSVVGPGAAMPSFAAKQRCISDGQFENSGPTSRNLAASLTWATSTPRLPLARRLHRSCAETTHRQQTVLINNTEIQLDKSLVPLVLRLNALGCHSITSCEGVPDSEWAFVMFTDRGGEEFARIWKQHLAPLGYEQPVLDHQLRDAEWRRDITEGEYPSPRPVLPGPDGINFTLLWRLYPEELEELMPDLLAALDRELAIRQGTR